jgi:hypothetical protein
MYPSYKSPQIPKLLFNTIITYIITFQIKSIKSKWLRNKNVVFGFSCKRILPRRQKKNKYN